MILDLFILLLTRGTMGKKTHGAPARILLIFLKVKLTKNQNGDPVPVDGINSEFEDGTPSFHLIKRIYFTRCEVGNAKKRVV